MNKRIFNSVKWVALVALSVGTLSGCKEKEIQQTSDKDYYKLEMEIFDEWMKSNQSKLVTSRQDEGYYIELDPSSTPTGEAIKPGGYVKYNITSSDLSGNIFNNRNETMAIQQMKYDRYTRYVPMTDYIPKESDGYWDDGDDSDYDYEAIELALMSEELTIDGVSTPAEFKAGSKFTLYFPSALSGGSVNGTGGYAGQYAHSGYQPIKSVVEITEVMNLPTENERADIDEFIAANEQLYPISDWELINDTGAHYIRLNKSYKPSETESFVYPNEYPYTKLLRDNAQNVGLPTTVEELNLAINAKWLDLYEEDKSKDEIGMTNACNVRYIVRTLDGFVLDTNIEEVQRIVYGAPGSNTSYVYYSADGSGDSYISAWYHVIPKLKYGQWAAFVTNSTNAYKNVGVAASSSVSEIPPHTPLLFELYIWPTSDDDDITGDE